MGRALTVSFCLFISDKPFMFLFISVRNLPPQLMNPLRNMPGLQPSGAPSREGARLLQGGLNVS